MSSHPLALLFDIQIIFCPRTCFQRKDGWLPLSPITFFGQAQHSQYLNRLLEHPRLGASHSHWVLSRTSARCEDVQLLRQDAKQVEFYFRKDLQSWSSVLCSDVYGWEWWATYQSQEGEGKARNLLNTFLSFPTLSDLPSQSGFPVTFLRS